MLRDWLGRIILTAALKTLPDEVFGLSTAAIIRNLPGLIEYIKDGWRRIEALKARGVPVDQATKAMVEVRTGRRNATTLENEAWADRGLTWTP